MKSMLVTIGLCLLIVIGYYGGRAYFLKPHLVQGQTAFDLKAQLANGTPFSLSDLKGKYVLLDFWGTWCGPCMQSHPALVQLYKQFHGKEFSDASDFEIVSIAVEANDRNWQKVIQVDQLDWPYHILASGMFESPLVKAYNVKQLPTKFLINPSGIIIGVDPSMSQVAKILEKKMK